MSLICLKICSDEAGYKAVARGEDEVNLVYQGQYVKGDRIEIEVFEPMLGWLSVDDTLDSSMVYIDGTVKYVIPFEEKRTNISDKSFMGDKHLITFRRAREYEKVNYRNLALNTCDQHLIENMYPHITANVETRGEAVFAAQNAIDGIRVNNCHGNWPYESWGINRQEDAMFRIEFGRYVLVDRIVLYTRADFPHDNYWTEVAFTFSDGSTLTMQLEKTEKPQEIVFAEKNICCLEMHDMKKSDEPSPFPALTQIEVWGKEH